MQNVMRRLSVCGLVACGAWSLAAGGIDPLRPNERIAFFGDSITHGGKYTYYLQMFECLRHPGSGVRMINCGRSGGVAGEVRDRFDWDVLDRRPDRIFVMFGMNDVGRDNYLTAEPDEKTRAARQQALDRYAASQAEIADRVKAAGKKLVLVTPPPYDQYSQAEAACAVGCNEPGLAACADIVRRLAAERGAGLIEFHRPLTDILRKHTDRRFCGRDRVHPGSEGHLLMAAIAWDEMGYAGPLAEMRVKANGPRVSFRYEPKALPFPTSAAYACDDEIYPLTEKFNREIFAVDGLPEGAYVLKADGAKLGQYTSAELARGVNIALLDTPSQRKAQEVEKLANELGRLCGDWRGTCAMDRQVRLRKADPSDYVAATNTLAGWVAEMKVRKQASAGYWSKLVDAYVNGGKLGEKESLRKQDELVRRMFETARPTPFEISVEPAK